MNVQVLACKLKLLIHLCLQQCLEGVVISVLLSLENEWVVRVLPSHMRGYKSNNRGGHVVLVVESTSINHVETMKKVAELLLRPLFAIDYYCE